MIRYDIISHTQWYDICRYLKKFYDTITIQLTNATKNI